MFRNRVKWSTSAGFQAVLVYMGTMKQIRLQNLHSSSKFPSTDLNHSIKLCVNSLWQIFWNFCDTSKLCSFKIVNIYTYNKWTNCTKKLWNACTRVNNYKFISMKLINYLSQNSINDSKLVDRLCWIYFSKMTTYNDMKLNKFIKNEYFYVKFNIFLWYWFKVHTGFGCDNILNENIL